ncbi:hypothetical protein DPU05_14765 [Salmonella enterica subsp. enterica serovar Teddington]|uniref:DUF2184 domain-containing protein n=1 Tax=Salmonella enterica subsp. enterica serovar Abeokuta TaxID=2926665 RepID=A0A8T9IEP5_SALET|nr:major capsid family protein [Salmonella enterica]EBW5579118.1 hypothetical protein [Salmonella enterica subsp. enterica serovar Teddington]ECC9827562.1 DUF2184 domain-containing protein [Salmonella enterica subsp. enterica]SQJ24886.1 Uncharacterized protein conserved in bacteria [Salmonella enterica subsp. enterica] [Salmonella enterica subsp. enterica serovar Menston]EDW6358915.1 DUF2184 domain-containing protein [Salmonella enterica subsp. enterica]UNO32295.1 DUF2184 domain-containing pro
MSKTVSQIHSCLGPRQVRPLHLTKCDSYPKGLAKLGICMDSRTLRTMAAAMDSSTLHGLSTSASNGAPVQALQTWLPGFVATVTQPRKIDDLIGITTVGSFEDEEIIQSVLELTGKAAVYGDYTNIPLSSWNVGYERRSVVRFEEGMQVGYLEAARSAKIKLDSAATKRNGAAISLEINRNDVGFYGYNNGTNRTYGMLNDPAAPAYKTLPAGASGKTQWSGKTFQEITADIRLVANALLVDSKSVVDPTENECTLTLANGSISYLSVSTETGMSVQDWISKTYPKWRIKTAPEFDGANGGANIMQLHAETIAADEVSTDDKGVWSQLVPAKFVTIGAKQDVKFYTEDFANATAGAMLKRPYACVRATGN